MAVVIRLARAGTNNAPFFHLVATDKSEKRDGKYLERLGFYNPKIPDESKKLVVDMNAVQNWIKKGAVPSETVGQLLKIASKSK